MGFEPKKAKRIIRELLKTKQVVCIDFAEVNPRYDIDNKPLHWQPVSFMILFPAGMILPVFVYE